MISAKQFLAAVAVASCLTVITLPVMAAPVAPATTVVASDAAAVTQIQYRGFRGGGYGGGRYYGRWRGPVIGLGVGSAIVAGAIIANQAYRPRRGYYYDTYAYTGPYYYPAGYTGDPRKICADHFRSFEWRTGMYTTFGGERRQCPYLR
jgi:hypothetical protein